MASSDSYFKKGSSHPRWSGGPATFPKCPDCGKRLSAKKSKYCRVHAFVRLRGDKHHNWKNGAGKLNHNVTEPEYKKWRMAVFTRDGFVCRICGTKDTLQAHHILRWADFPELRYVINNGIALCRAHHPRKKSEEKRLMSTFVELVSVSSVQY